MSTKILYSLQAIKQLKKISQTDKLKVKKKILQLKSNPLQGKALKGKLTALYSLRAWPIRVIYTFDPKKKTGVLPRNSNTISREFCDIG